MNGGPFTLRSSEVQVILTQFSYPVWFSLSLNLPCRLEPWAASACSARVSLKLTARAAFHTHSNKNLSLPEACSATPPQSPPKRQNRRIRQCPHMSCCRTDERDSLNAHVQRERGNEERRGVRGEREQSSTPSTPQEDYHMMGSAMTTT